MLDYLKGRCDMLKWFAGWPVCQLARVSIKTGKPENWQTGKPLLKCNSRCIHYILLNWKIFLRIVIAVRPPTQGLL